MKEQIETLRNYFAACPETGAIVCEFNGAGDSGSVTEAYAVKNYSLDDGIGAATGVPIDPPIAEAAEEVALAALEKQGVDWYNNDGGQGEVAIMRSGEVLCNTQQNYTEVNTFLAEFSLGAEGVEAGKHTV